ncbi:MarR family transcriptional regulator [Aureisphaera galaxeae]|uniref:MarR family winged helix-turn-helix transcriptional regulator n=1 Tax=Aureisphaera galaxeae TaxID=1538023 RepID=UPI0023502291|nr:MarR family transcriptional regulator [Aureisphaera galaxeae]MDC8004428.1 MarR family transcriptional regulator [Aureisphaera galaxeae]
MTIEEAIKSTVKIPLPARTVINIMYTSRYIEKSIDRFKTRDITMQQYNVLRILRGQKGNPANLSTLQERMIDKSSNTTRLVDKLIVKELVERRVCEQNRRKVEIFITEKGLQLLKDLDPVTDEANKEILKHLTKDEQETLNTLLDKLRSNE